MARIVLHALFERTLDHPHTLAKGDQAMPIEPHGRLIRLVGKADPRDVCELLRDGLTVMQPFVDSPIARHAPTQRCVVTRTQTLGHLKQGHACHRQSAVMARQTSSSESRAPKRSISLRVG